MKILINKSNVDKIQFTEKPTFYRDSKLIGFCVRACKSKISYIIDSRNNGKLFRMVIGDVKKLSPDEARKIAKETLGKLASGINICEEEKKKKIETVTLQDAYNEYIATKKLSPNTLKDYSSDMNTVFNDWRKLPLTSITRTMVQKKFTERSKSTPTTTNRNFRFLRALFNFAIEQYRVGEKSIINENPCNVIKAMKIWNKEQPRQTMIALNDLSTFWRVISPLETDSLRLKQTKVQCKLCLLTGCRDQEIASLKRKDIDFRKKLITFEHTKNGRKHILPYGNHLGKLLKDLCNGLNQDDFLFPAVSQSGHIQNHRKEIEKLVNKCGFKFTLHDLRRTFSTYAGEHIGIDVTIVDRLTNHVINSVTFRHYTVADPERLRRPMQQIEDFILRHVDVIKDN